MTDAVDDEDFVQELVSAFMEECRDGVQECQRALKDEDREAIKTAAHGLKGSAAIFGAEELSEAAKQLEYAIKYENITDMDALKTLTDALVAQVNSLDKEDLMKAAAAMA